MHINKYVHTHVSRHTYSYIYTIHTYRKVYDPNATAEIFGSSAYGFALADRDIYAHK